MITRVEEIEEKVRKLNPFTHHCIVSYDTLILNARLSREEIKDIFNLIDESNFYTDKNYRYVFHHKEAGFTLKMLQHDFARRTQYTAKITIHRAFYEAENVGYLLEVINLYRDKWCVKNAHIAFDFLSNKDNSVIIKHHLNVKGTKFVDLEHRVTEYTGSLRCSNRAGARLLANYDRNEREQSRNNESDYAFANRLEARLSFATDEIMFSAFGDNDEQAHQLISSRLEALLFVVDIDELVECPDYLKRSFKAIQRDINKINEYKKRKSKNKILADIKRVAKLNRFNFEVAYNNNRNKLLEVFNVPVSLGNEVEESFTQVV